MKYNLDLHNRHIALYGAGIAGRDMSMLLNKIGIQADFFVDSNPEVVRKGECYGIKVISKEQMSELNKDTAIIISIGIHKIDVIETVDKMLQAMGFHNIYYSVIEMVESLYPHLYQKLLYAYDNLVINTIVGCPVVCKYCPQTLFTRQYKKHIQSSKAVVENPCLLSFDVFKKCIDNLPPSMGINFSGYSEPFLNPECADMIVYAYEKGYRPIELFSTLLGMTLQDIDKIKNIPFDKIALHLPDIDGNSKIPVTPNYVEVLKSFLTVFKDAMTKDSQGRIIEQCISIHGKIHPIVEEIFNSMQIDLSILGNITARFNSRAGSIDVPPESACEFSDKHNIAGMGYVRNQLRMNRDCMSVNRDTLFYLQMNKNFVLLPNGDISLCCQDYGLKSILGNLLVNKYDELCEDNSEYGKFLHALRSGNIGNLICAKCGNLYPRGNLHVIERCGTQNNRDDQ